MTGGSKEISTIFSREILSAHEGAEDSGPSPPRHIPLGDVSRVGTYVSHSTVELTATNTCVGGLLKL